MAILAIRTYRNGSTQPDRTISVPLNILRVASKLIPRAVLSGLEEKGVDVRQIVEVAENEDIEGTLCEIVEHGKNERTVIAIER